MRIRLLVGLSGPTYSLGPGDERDFLQAEAVRLIQAGYAVPVSAGDIEKAVRLPAPETRHSLDYEGDGRPERTDDLADLRAQYQELFGKRPFMGWDAAVLHKKIDAKLTE